MENSKSAANGMSVEEAMKVLNMKKFDAEELNDKFRFRIQSVAQGLGGSLKAQKDIYRAWEYLNRMLARESSTNTEQLLRKADKTPKMYEKPKRLDMIPFKLSNPARKASLIIEKEDKKIKPEKQVKSILKVKGPESIGSKLPPIHFPKPSETAKYIRAPGGGPHKRVRWAEDKNKSTTELVKSKQLIPSKMQFRKKLNFRSTPSRRRLLSKKENTMLQLKEFTESIKMETVEAFGDETKVTSGMLPKELRKLLKPGTIPFKRVPVLNEIYSNPKRLSRHDQRSAALRLLWREESDHILKDAVLPDKAKRKHSQVGGKTSTSGKRLMRKSLQKQEEVLYRKSPKSSSEMPSANDLRTHESSWGQRIVNPSKEVVQAPTGLYTSSRIRNWIESSEHHNPE